MSTLSIDALLAEIGHDLAEHIGEYGGHDAILVPNESITYEFGVATEVPSPVELMLDKIQMFPTRTTFELLLTSASMRITNTAERSGRVDFNAVGVGHRQLQVHVGGQWLDVGEFITLLLKAANKHEQRSSEQILTSLRQRGLALSESMPIFFQHLGADKDKFYDQLVPFMLSQGAVDNTDQVNRSARATRAAQAATSVVAAPSGFAVTERSVRFENRGLRLLSFVAGTSDRTRSATHNGYLSPLDATYTTLMAIVQADRLIATCDSIINNPEATDDDKALASAQRSAMLAYWTSGQQRNRRPFHNWGGTTSGQNKQIPGALQFYSTSVPCAEFVVEGLDGQAHEFNMWRRNAAAVANEIVLPNVTAIDLATAAEHSLTTPSADSGADTPYE